MSIESIFPIYEQQIRLDRSWGMDEVDRFFQRDNSVFKTLRKLSKKLDELGVLYATAGGMALEAHGFVRVTIDVDLIVTKDGLSLIHEKLDGLGYLPPFEKSKNLRDTEHGVRIKFLVAGEFPGDGKPKPVAFPDPADVAVDLGGIKFVSLPSLVELKLASGMTGGMARLKDFADVIALIQTLQLPEDFSDKLNPYVRDKYAELWTGLRDSPNVI